MGESNPQGSALRSENGRAQQESATSPSGEAEPRDKQALASPRSNSRAPPLQPSAEGPERGDFSASCVRAPSTGDETTQRGGEQARGRTKEKQNWLRWPRQSVRSHRQTGYQTG